jgi:ABC-type transporter MlaC component
MTRSPLLLPTVLGAALFAFVVAAAEAQPYPMVDKVADKVIAKYQNSSCDQLAAKKAEPPSAMHQRALQLLRQDAQMRTYFINKIAAPIANKMFECGMVP